METKEEKKTEDKQVVIEELLKTMDKTIKSYLQLGIPLVGDLSGNINVPESVMLHGRILAEMQSHFLVLSNVLTEIIQNLDTDMIQKLTNRLNLIVNEIEKKKNEARIVVPGKNVNIKR